MANTIKIRRSATASAVPTTAQIALGELAVNTYDGKLFLKKSTTGNETGAGTSIIEVGATSTSAVNAQAYNTSSITGVTTAAAISFGGESFDTGTIWASTPNPTRLTVPSAGVYSINFTALVTFTSDTYVLTFSLRKNGTEIRQFIFRENWRWFSGDTLTIQINEFASLAANDYLEMFHSGDGTGYSIGTTAATRAQFTVARG